jgi:hypothetical protein
MAFSAFGLTAGMKPCADIVDRQLRADIVAKRFFASERATLIQDQAYAMLIQKSIPPDSIVAHFCSQAAPRRLLQQYLPQAVIRAPARVVWARQAAENLRRLLGHRGLRRDPRTPY